MIYAVIFVLGFVFSTLALLLGASQGVAFVTGAVLSIAIGFSLLAVNGR